MRLPADMLIHSLSDAATVHAVTRHRAFAGTNSRAKGGLHVTATLEYAPDGENIGLFKNGALAEIKGAGPGGVSFYDLDDGVYYAASTESAAAWRITVAGTVVTVEPLGGGAPVPTYGQIFPLGR